eukprot:72985-Rhodomonas_salina.2
MSGTEARRDLRLFLNGTLLAQVWHTEIAYDGGVRGTERAYGARAEIAQSIAYGARTETAHSAECVVLRQRIVLSAWYSDSGRVEQAPGYGACTEIAYDAWYGDSVWCSYGDSV